MSGRIQAIDVHGHYGVSRDQPCRLANVLMTADAAEVERRAAAAGIAVTVVSPLAGLFNASPEDVERANRHAARQVARRAGLRQWAVVNPLAPRTLDQAADLLARPGCVGVKIHPELHGYTIRRYGRRLMEFAERRDAVVLTHSGQPKSLPAHFADLANDFPSVRLILAHLGFGHDRDISLQVRAIQKSRHGNLYADTSSSMSIVSRLIEWAVAEVGADRLLFGTDTPLYFAAMQRARIEAADISAADKRRILRDNARRLLRIDLPGR